MRQLFRTGRRRALALFVIPASLVLMGNQCEPLTKEPLKPELPLTGLSIDPTTHDFGESEVTSSPAGPQTFTVTNHGPDASGLLTTAVEGDPDFLPFISDDCDEAVLEPDEACEIEVVFAPQEGPRSATLVVEGDPGGTATATLSGIGIPS